MTGLLHTIYGPQLSSLLFAPPDIVAGDECRGTNAAETKPLARPKSSPAGRKQIRPRSAATALPLVTRPRPTSALSTTDSRGRGGGSKIRPKSAAVGTVEYYGARCIGF